MKIFFTLLLTLTTTLLFAQRSKRKAKAQQYKIIHVVDSMVVNLYTDSLKKGTYNYINVDGKLDNGHFIPLDTTDVIFKASDGKFSGNSLWLEPDFKKDKVTIEVTLKKDPAQQKTFDIYIKKAPDPELKSEGEILKKDKRGS